MKHLWNGLCMSISMYTILPIKSHVWDEKACKYLIPFYPFAGCLIGVLWYGLYRLLEGSFLPIMMKTFLLMALPAIISGFLHLDGFMDTSDAIGSRRSLEEKQRILKDSHVGAFAVIFVVFWLFASFCSMYTILNQGKEVVSFLFIPIVSRAFTGICVLSGKPISKKSYLTLYQKERRNWQIPLQIAYILGFSMLAFILGGVKTVAILAILLVTAIVMKRHAVHELGGMSGDISGYILTISEVVSMAAVAII